MLDLDGKPVMFQERNDIEFRGSLSGQTYARFCDLINEDIFGYYNIEDCETALLKEEFSNSQEGHCCPEKFYHKVGCSTEPASGTLTGVVG